MSEPVVFIYALTIDWEQWYIGKSIDPWLRHQEHLRDAFRPAGSNYLTKKYQWIRSLPDPSEVQMIILEVCAERFWQRAEREWIAIYREDFGTDNVMNDTDGGDGGCVGENNPNAKYPNWVKEMIRHPDQSLENVLTILEYAGIEMRLKYIKQIRRGVVLRDLNYEPLPFVDAADFEYRRRSEGQKKMWAELKRTRTFY